MMMISSVQVSEKRYDLIVDDILGRNPHNEVGMSELLDVLHVQLLHIVQPETIEQCGNILNIR